jgi:hypothetical protein
MPGTLLKGPIPGRQRNPERRGRQPLTLTKITAANGDPRKAVERLDLTGRLTGSASPVDLGLAHPHDRLVVNPPKRRPNILAETHKPES